MTFKSERNSRIELLRIISMFLIVAWHWSTQYKVINDSAVLDSGVSLYHIYAILIGSWGQVGVDLFVIISAYYLGKRNCFSSRKLVDLIFQTFFYFIFWMVLCFYLLNLNISNIQILKSAFSIFSGSYWFITAYALMYIFSPIINNLLRYCTSSHLIKISVMLTLFISFYKTIFKEAPVCDFMFFITIYVVIQTIEKTNIRELIIKNAGRGFVISLLFLLSINFILMVIGDICNNNFIISHSYYLNLRGSVFVFVASLFAFYFVLELPAFYSKFINFIAGSCLGVYLSHQGMGGVFWNKLLTRDFGVSWSAILYMNFSVMTIFAVGVFVDLLRRYTVGVYFHKMISIERISTLLNKVDNYLNG